MNPSRSLKNSRLVGYPPEGWCVGDMFLAILDLRRRKHGKE